MKHTRILLIHPPVAKPCEPPAGLARLHGALAARGIASRLWDASLEGLLWLLGTPLEAADTWSRRAIAHTPASLAALRGPALYAAPARYRQAVLEVNQRLHLAGRQRGAAISLANYGEAERSPVRSADLLAAAEGFAGNPFHPFFRERLAALLAAETPDVVGLSVNFLSQALCAFALAGCLREMLPGVRIVMGGGLITSWLGIPGVGNPFRGLVDDLVAGPGEDPLLAMCGVGPADPVPAAVADYAPLPLEAYLSPGMILPCSTSRGCYWRRCAFCPEKAEGGGYFPRREATVRREIARGASRAAPGLIHFLDNALAPRLLKALAAEPPGVPWYGFVRVTEHLADPALAAGLKAAGCVMLKLGVESGDQGVLDALGKGVGLATVSRVLTNLRRAGIGTYVYLLFGTPAEDAHAARRTLTFTAAHAGAIDFLNLAIFNLPAASPEARSLATLDFYAGDLSLYKEFAHPRGWNRDRVRRFLSREFKRHPAVAPILAHDPPGFTSNHAPLLLQYARAAGA